MRRIYNSRNLPEKKKKRRKRKKRKKEEGERLLGDERSWEFTSSNEESFLPGT